MEQRRLNLPVVLGATIVGLAAIGLGLHFGGWTRDAWSAVLIEAGAAIGLVSSIVVLERRMVRDVAESTARTEVERVAGDLRHRIQRLEELDADQEQVRSEQRRLNDERLQAIRDGRITSASVGEVLIEAINDRLIDPDVFHVRTSAHGSCPLLYMLPFVDASRVVAIYLDFEPFELAKQPILVDGEPIPVPRKTDSTVMWMDDDAASIGADLSAGLERRNEPHHDFGFGHALGSLLEGIELMRSARAAPAGSPRRLSGQLRVAINDDWVYTTAGLEAVAASTLHVVKPAGWLRSSRWLGAYMHISKDERSTASASLNEALTWLEQREGVRLLEPGADPVDTIFPGRR